MANHKGMPNRQRSTGQGCRAELEVVSPLARGTRFPTRRHSVVPHHGSPILDEIYRSVGPRRGSRGAYHEFAVL